LDAGPGACLTALHRLEQLRELVRRLERVQAHHSDGRPVVEDHGQDRALADQRELDAALRSLVEEHGEFVLAEDLGHLPGGRERARDERGDRVEVEVLHRAGPGDQVPVLVDEERARRTRQLDELSQDLIDARDLVAIKDEPLLAKAFGVVHGLVPRRWSTLGSTLGSTLASGLFSGHRFTKRKKRIVPMIPVIATMTPINVGDIPVGVCLLETITRGWLPDEGGPRRVSPEAGCDGGRTGSARTGL